ncbi:MAG: hypothetical protein QXI09_02190 [Candidatus Aenigmatarchaeota archaeon]
MNLIFFLFSLLDIMAGGFYLTSVSFSPIYLLLLIKGFWTIFSCILAKDYFFSILGFMDAILGFLGLLSFFEIKIIGIAVLIKGLYSIIFSF